MRPFESLQRHVPAGARHRIGKHARVALLSLRVVHKALADRGTVLLCAACESVAMLEPLLRATRSGDAVLALTPAGPLASRRGRHRFFSEVVARAQATGCNRPLILVAPPLHLGPIEEADLKAERIHEWIEAGYTHVPIDLSGLDLARVPAALLRAATPLLEHELGIELLVEPGQEDEVGELCAALKLVGIEVDLIGVRGGGAVGMAVAASEVDPIAVSWWEGDEAEDFRSGLRNAVGAGARLVTLRSPFTRELLAGLPGAIQDAEDPLGEISAALEAGTLDGDVLDRAELGLLSEAEDLLRLLRLRGAASELLSALKRGSAGQDEA